MENFGNIKDTFKKIIIESVIKKDSSGKKLFGKYLKTLKENKTIRDQFLIYKNLETKKFDDKFEAKEYLNENIELLKSIDKNKINESNNSLLKLLKGKKIVKENNEFYKNISYLGSTKKTPSNINQINEATNKLIEFMTTKNEIFTEEINHETINVPPSVLTKLFVNKFNSKYSDINESDKKIIHSILNGSDSEKEDIYNKLKRDCVITVDSKLNESSDLDLKDKLLKVKDKLLNTKYQKDNFSDDIIKFYNLKQTITND
jgi:hypothetical protein